MIIMTTTTMVIIKVKTTKNRWHKLNYVFTNLADYSKLINPKMTRLNLRMGSPYEIDEALAMFV